MGMREDFEKWALYFEDEDKHQFTFNMSEREKCVAFAAYQAASLAAAEKVKEEAARVCNVRFKIEGGKWASFTANWCEQNIRAIDVKKLLEQN